MTPILNLEDLKNNNYLNERNSIIIDSSNSSIPEKLQFQIAPSPKLSKHNLTKRDILRKNAKLGGNTYEILKEFIADSVEIKEYYKDSQKNSSKL